MIHERILRTKCASDHENSPHPPMSTNVRSRCDAFRHCGRGRRITPWARCVALEEIVVEPLGAQRTARPTTILRSRIETINLAKGHDDQPRAAGIHYVARDSSSMVWIAF